MSEHKYRVGDTLWIGSGFNGSTFKGEVLLLSNKSPFSDLKPAPTYILRISTYEVYGSFEMDNHHDVLEIYEADVLADYNDEEQMKKYRGG